jgi:hypothetical protein
MNRVATDAFVRRASRKASWHRDIAEEVEFETPRVALAGRTLRLRSGQASASVPTCTEELSCVD